MTNCLICDSPSTSIVYESHKQPLGRYGFCRTKDDATNIRADFSLEIRECKQCGFAWNQTFDASRVDYSSLPVLESSSHSGDYHSYQAESAKWLVSFLDNQPSKVLEIGGGSGFFISQLNIKDKILYEPSIEAAKLSPDVKLIPKYFDPSVDRIDADLVVMRQVLEHIDSPLEFITNLRNSFLETSGTSLLHVYIEVPSHDRTTDSLRFSDFYYEHCNYFTLTSLSIIAKKTNGRVRCLIPRFNGEINTALIEYKKPTQCHTSYNDILTVLIATIESSLNIGGEMVLWGASGNGITILNSIGTTAKHISYVIDSDPRKHGLYIPVTGHEIVSPSDIRLQKVSSVIIASQFHVDEIVSEARKIFGTGVNLISVTGQIT